MVISETIQGRRPRRSRLPLLVAGTLTISLLAAGAAIFVMYDPHAVLPAIGGADFSFLVFALMVGTVIQVLRAQRVAVIVRARYPVSLEQTFGARVLSHAVTGVVPLGPAGVGLEGVLLRRLAQIPVAYSAGVLTACSLLDRVAGLPLLAIVLLTAHLPGWLRIVLLGTMIHSLLSLSLPPLAAATRSRLAGFVPRRAWQKALQTAATQVEDGLATIVTGDWRIALPALALSCLLVALSVLRLALLLAAFELTPSAHQLVLLALMSGLLGSAPVQIPGASAWATGKLMRLMRLVGPSTGAYILVSSVIGIVEAPLLALGVLVWWALPHSRMSFRLTDVVAIGETCGSEPRSGLETV